MDSARARARLMEVEAVRNVEEIRTSEGENIFELLHPLPVSVEHFENYIRALCTHLVLCAELSSLEMFFNVIGPKL